MCASADATSRFRDLYFAALAYTRAHTSWWYTRRRCGCTRACSHAHHSVRRTRPSRRIREKLTRPADGRSHLVNVHDFSRRRRRRRLYPVPLSCPRVTSRTRGLPGDCRGTREQSLRARHHHDPQALPAEAQKLVNRSAALLSGCRSTNCSGPDAGFCTLTCTNCSSPTSTCCSRTQDNP